MAGLRREPSQFFIFFLINYTSVFVMSAVFRTMAALTKTISQAMALAGILVLAIVVYTGFVVPIDSMKPWFGKKSPLSTLLPALTADVTFQVGSAGSIPSSTHSKSLSPTSSTAASSFAASSYQATRPCPATNSSAPFKVQSLVGGPSTVTPTSRRTTATPTVTSGATLASCWPSCLLS